MLYSKLSHASPRQSLSPSEIIGYPILGFTTARLLDSAWDLDNPVAFRIHDGDDPINCMCQVQQKLWLGAGNRCYVFNMASSRREVYRAG